jgi:hypothetical protein
MAGHRAGHLSPRVPIEMTGSVAGHDAYVNVLDGWYKYREFQIPTAYRKRLTGKPRATGPMFWNIRRG